MNGSMSSNATAEVRTSSIAHASEPELTVVIPCLNEAETLPACIEVALQTMRLNGIAGEIIVADNGSTDDSPTIAARLGARVVHVEPRGYGVALRRGISSARGRYIIMGDADGSYDFSQIPKFLERLRSGFDVVMGNRFKGGIQPGAMRPLHRYLGIPILTRLARLLFKSPCGDNHCGLRAFSRSAFARMGLQAKGWDFGSEMLVRANLLGMKVTELPTPLLPDGRGRPSHLRTWRAGWQHLRLMLLYSPRWLFLYPGALLMLAGFMVGLWLLPGPQKIGRVTFDVHTLLYAGMAVLLGFQSVAFATFAKLVAITKGLLPRDPRLERIFRAVNLERGLALGAVLMAAGIAASIDAVGVWGARNFGPLDQTSTLRLVIPAVIMLTLGLQIILSSFFLGVLRMGED